MMQIEESQLRKLEFQQELYRILLDYRREQEGAPQHGSGTTVGDLGIGLTRVFDRVTEAYERQAAPPARA